MLTTEKKIMNPLTVAQGEDNHVIEKLNFLLCNLQVHYQKLRSYHWNVTGPNFFELHQVFEKEYNIIKTEIDEIAERIRVFGRTPKSLLRDYLEHSVITETSPNIPAQKMVSEILKDFKTLTSIMDELIAAASEAGDTSTEDLITGFKKRIEKKHWMLTAFSK